MKLDINISEFLTKEHKEGIQKKITEAIEKINTSKLSKSIENDLMEFDYGDYIVDRLDFEEISEKMTEVIKKNLFK